MSSQAIASILELPVKVTINALWDMDTFLLDNEFI